MMSLITTFFLSFFILATANIEMPQDAPPRQDVFNEILMRTGMKLQEVAGKRPHRLKAMNDSIEAMAQSMRGMASKQDPHWIMARLEEAQKAYSPNPFASLLQGVIAGTLNDIPLSNRYLEAFLLESKQYTEFEKSFLPWDPYQRLRRLVYELLLSRGIRFEGREKEIQMQVPLQALMQYVKDPEPRDERWNLFFVLFLSFGTISIFIAKLRGAEGHGFWPQTFFYLYLSTWIAYGVWFCDLAAGLPGEWNRFQWIPVILLLPVVWRAWVLAYTVWHRRRIPLEEGYQRCPFCGEVIQMLLVECPECRKKLP